MNRKRDLGQIIQRRPFLSVNDLILLFSVAVPPKDILIDALSHMHTIFHTRSSREMSNNNRGPCKVINCVIHLRNLSKHLAARRSIFGAYLSETQQSSIVIQEYGANIDSLNKISHT